MRMAVYYQGRFSFKQNAFIYHTSQAGIIPWIFSLQSLVGGGIVGDKNLQIRVEPSKLQISLQQPMLKNIFNVRHVRPLPRRWSVKASGCSENSHRVAPDSHDNCRVVQKFYVPKLPGNIFPDLG